MVRINWKRVMALYSKRVKARRYLWDVRPWELRSNEFERLIVDSIYGSNIMGQYVNKEDVYYLQKAYGRLPYQLKHTIQKHLA
jgi:hypothetical protein